jgi:hypothetical protein
MTHSGLAHWPCCFWEGLAIAFWSSRLWVQSSIFFAKERSKYFYRIRVDRTRDSDEFD